MKRIIALTLCLILVFSVVLPAIAVTTGAGSFVLTVVTANDVIIEPTYIPYTPGQTIQQALLASGHRFVGLEQGFIYEVDGVVANFSLFYDGNGYDLTAEASGINVLCIGVTCQYSEELLDLIERMAQFRQLGNVQNYPGAKNAYSDGLKAIRNGNASVAKDALDRLNLAIDTYEEILNGTKYTVSVAAAQGTGVLDAPVVTLTDIYGNETTVAGNTLEVVAGEYRFIVSDGAYNRTEGTISVSGNTTLSTTLPSGEWFGDVKILNGKKDPYPYTQDTASHTAVYQIPDTAKELSSLYLNVGQGSVPDSAATKLRTIYVGTNAEDFAAVTRSWESTATALTYLVKPGMEGVQFQLEAQYTDGNGHTQIQAYTMMLERTPTLADLTVTAEGTRLPVAFDPTTYTYEVITVSDTLVIEGKAYQDNYKVQGTGSFAAAPVHTVTVSADGKDVAYTLNVTKKTPVNVTLAVPSGVTVILENSAGGVIMPVNGVYKLIPGESYTYRATKNVHYHTAYTFTAEEGLHISVVAPTDADWLSGLAVYNGSNASTRKEYPCDSSFASADHSYVFRVSDCNTTVYLQATSAYTVTAYYMSQTTAAATHGKTKTIVISKEVNTSGSAQILSQVIARSGYANTVTLRVSYMADGITYYQDYTLLFARELHMNDFSAADAEGDLVLFDADGASCEYDRDRNHYRLNVSREETTLYLTGSFPNVSDATDCCGGYSVHVNGGRYASLDKVAVALNPEKNMETVTVQICHADSNAVVTTYTFIVEKTDPVAINFQTTPANAVVYLVNTLNGKRIFGNNGVYLLTPGVTYAYIVTCAGYKGISGTYTAPSENTTKSFSLTKAPANQKLQELESYWPHLRQNDDNNGVVSAPTPVKAEDAVLYWATKIGDGYDKNACGCPILVDGYLYTYAGSKLYKVDTVSGKIVATGEMDHASSFAINPPTYADGMLFIGLADGSVQAFNASTLESLWIYRDPLGGQPNCSIVYHDGYVYTGFWVGETSNANFVCINATDEDPTQTKEEKLATWRFTSLGGFYWAGAYVCDDYLLIGTDDGASGYTTGHSRLLSFDPLTGELLDECTMEVVGDIRSSITAYNGKYYFTNKGGYFFEAIVTADGKIEKVNKLKLYNYADEENAPPMSTCTPTIYNGRAYVGVSGVSQFGAYSGHNITVIDIPNWEIAYSVRTQGYPQTSGVLTTAYEKVDGCVYVYFFDNYTPGKLRVLKDKPGQTEPMLTSTEIYTDKGTTTVYETAYSLFTPNGDQAQYAICSPIIDEYGTIYFKNDSAYLMAVGSTVSKLEVRQDPEKMDYQAGETFDAVGMQVIAHYTNGTSRDVTAYVTWSTEKLTVNDTDFEIMLPYVMYQNHNGEVGVDYMEPFVILQLTISGGEAKTGDVNADGRTDMRDVSLLLAAINADARAEEQIELADLNRDGQVDIADITLLLQWINGNVTDLDSVDLE